MIWTIIFIVLFVLFVMAMITTYDTLMTELCDTFLVAAILDFVALLFCVFLIVCSHMTVNHDIEKARLEYDHLIQEVEVINSEYEDVSRVQVIEDVYEWNKKVYSSHHWTNSPWTSWFNSKKYDESLNYISLDEVDE